MSNQLHFLFFIILVTFSGFYNHFILLDKLYINKIKWIMYKNTNMDININDQIDFDRLFNNYEWQNLILTNQSVKNSETILFIVGYFWIVYILYYESSIILYPIKMLIRLKNNIF